MPPVRATRTMLTQANFGEARTLTKHDLVSRATSAAIASPAGARRHR
jgi:hypothetical protein